MRNTLNASLVHIEARQLGAALCSLFDSPVDQKHRLEEKKMKEGDKEKKEPAKEKREHKAATEKERETNNKEEEEEEEQQVTKCIEKYICVQITHLFEHTHHTNATTQSKLFIDEDKVFVGLLCMQSDPQKIVADIACMLYAFVGVPLNASQGDHLHLLSPLSFSCLTSIYLPPRPLHTFIHCQNNKHASDYM